MSLGKLVMNLIRSMPAMSCDPREQVGEPADPAVGLAILVAVDRLAQERDLLDALVGQQPGLGQDRAGRPALLGPADRGHDAVRAELVAAHHDPDERLERAGPHRRLAVGVVALEARRDRLERAGVRGPAHGQLAATRASRTSASSSGTRASWPGPDDEVDVRRAAEDRLLVLLGHAAQDADGHLRLALLEPLDPAQSAVDLVLGVLPDRARVVEDRVGLVDVVGQLVAFLRSLATTSSLSSRFIWQPTVSM